ncbi:MAG TPA: hypothetical protein VL084_07220 [Thermoanaerobaculia bacterium]|nr:hypothetical protein [Thermoanaerobaculia bacterium]
MRAKPARLLRFAPALALAAILLAASTASTASAASAVLSKAGTLYEVYATTYGQVVGDAAGQDAATPVLALRTTPSGAAPAVQIVDGTLDSDVEGSESIEFEEESQTVFLVFTKEQSLFRGVNVALLRDGQWSVQLLLPTSGFTLAMNPKMSLTRQKYLDASAEDASQTVEKWRSIVSVVWWEEGTLSQARYSALFVEDGALNRDAIQSYGLNDLVGASGPTSTAGRSPASYSFPAIQRSYAGDGSVLVSFANLASQRQTVASISFQSLPDAGPGLTGPVAYSRHRPIVRTSGDGSIPGGGIALAMSPGTVISPGGSLTFWWIEGSTMKILSGDAPADAAPLSIPIRPDFSVDKALAVVREMAEKE